ncbi:MAG TPA: DUF5719 family protein [Acidimicrobiia bacterium]|jgi:hypothetical protein
MKGWLMAVAIVTLGIAGPLVAAAPTGEAPEVPVITEPSFLVCTGAEAGGGFTSHVAVASAEAGGVTATAIGTGSSETVAINSAGGADIDVDRLAELGVTPLLMELPTDQAGAATVTRSGTADATSSCAGAPGESQVLAGASSQSGEDLTLIVANPFAPEARVQVAASGELGEEVVAELEEVVVPPSTAISLPVGRILPARESLSIRIDPLAGRVAAALRQVAATDAAVWEGRTGSQEWFIPLPVIDGAGASIALAAAAPIGFEYTVEPAGQAGQGEMLTEGSVAAGGQAIIPASALGASTKGVVISATEPVVADLMLSGPDARAVTPGASRSALRWLVPGAGPDEATSVRLWVLTVDDQLANITVTPLAPGYAPRAYQPDPRGLTMLQVAEGPSQGVIVDGDAEIVVVWTSQRGASVALATATPLEE